MALTKVTYTDLVTIIGAQNLNDIQDAIIALEGWQTEVGADIPQILADIAPSFSNSTSYSAGDCVIVLKKLYQFTADHPAGDWTGADATEVNVTSLLKEAADSLSGQVDSVKAQALASYATDSASGAIASFPDGADDIPVKDLSVAINPVQDLHGYDNPWPGGSGKNKLENAGISGSSGGLTWTMNDDGSISLSGTTGEDYVNVGINPTDNMQLLGSGTISLVISALASYNPAITGINFQNDIYVDGVYSSTLQRGTITKEYSGTQISVGNSRLRIAPNTSIPSGTKFYPAIEIGTAISSEWTPYSNICPISGWTGAEVTRANSNLFASTWESGVWDTSGNKGTSNTVVRTADKIPVKPGVQYAIHRSVNTSYINVRCFDKNGVYLGTGSDWMNLIQGGTAANPMQAGMSSCVISVKPGCWYFTFNDFSNDVNTQYTMVAGDTASADFVSPSSDTYSITFPTEAGTVYGGTLDVTTGKLTVDQATVDLGTLTWNRMSTNESGKYRFGAALPGGTNQDSGSVIPNMLCSVYKATTPNATYLRQNMGITNNVGSDPQVIVYDPAFEIATAADFKTAMSGVQLVYELATPTVYDLTPTEATTLLAQNNIWADTGDSTVEYRADTKLYIDKKIAALAAAMN